MNVSNIILEKIKNDLTFRLGLANALSLSERQIQNLVKSTEKGKSVRLRDHLAIQFYLQNGYTNDQIFTLDNKREILDTI